jgi:SNF2 family DNA or RNA helicase
MRVVHGVWAYGSLCLCGEDSERPATAQRRPGRPSRAPRQHPFACDPDALTDVVAGLAGPAADLAFKAVEDELTLWLPGTADGPQAAPELIRGPDRESGKAGRTLTPWRVPALGFDAASALHLLCALGEPGALSAQAVPGASVLYLAALARLAADLAARGRTLPVLASEDGGYAARWRPVPSGAHAQRVRELAAAMPPLCRATAVKGEPAAAVLTDALDALTDAAARALLGTEPGFGLLAARRGRRPARVPVAERWASALTGSDAQVSVVTPEDQAEAAELAAGLDAWRQTAQLPVGPVRACFRLIEPEQDAGEGAEAEAGAAAPAGADWQVEFSLQSTDDPSLRLSAADIWSGAAVSGWAASGIKHPEEDLLAGLGRAARLFPELDGELRSAAPAAVALDTAGAFGFLKQTGPLLSGAGFGVLLPDWARRARLGLKVTTRSRKNPGGSAAEAMFGLEDLVDFRYDLAVGDETLDPDELEELARLKIPLVRLRGQWVELDDRHLRAALRFLERGQAGTMRAGDALLVGLRGPDGVDGELPVQVDADGWLGDLLSGQVDRRLQPVRTPAGFAGSLRPYQERGLAWLSFLGELGLGGILADDMGLGKCLLPETPVFVNGSLGTAAELWNNFAGPRRGDGEGEWALPAAPLTINARTGAGVMAPAPVTRLYRQHISEPVRTVLLDDGSEISITRRHRLLGPRGWTRELAPGDRICVPARLRWTGVPVDPGLTRLLARQVAGACADPAAPGKPAIPDFIVAADDSTIRLFLSEYFSAAGSVRAGPRCVEISSASMWLMQQLSCMLRRLGIWLRISKRAASGPGNHVGRIGGAALRRFREQVGFCDSVRQDELARLSETAADTAAEVDGAGDPPALASSATAGRAVAVLDRVVSGVAAADTDGDVCYARVVSVTDVGYTGWVYDLEVAEHHNFVAAGMLCHNTVQMLGLMAHERPPQPAARAVPPTLLICPMSLVGNWQREAERFTPQLAVHVHHGSDRLAGDELTAALSAADLVITTYGLAARDLQALSKIGWHRVVCDEAQNIKNSVTRQAQAVRALPAGSRIALTGTPVENRLAELWSIMEFTSPGLLGPAERFRQRYAIPIERGGDEAATASLKRITGPFILRRLKTDKTIISDLPDKLEMKIWCNLTPEQASLYQATVTDMLARIEAAEEEIERRGLVLATMAKLKQVCNHPAHLLGDGSRLEGRSGKLARLEEICDEIVAEGDKALCFTQYAEFGRMLQPYLAARLGCEVPYLHGGTPKKQRDALVARFQEEAEPAVFVLSLKAGGTGLNLTAASHVIHVDRWWNPAVEDQATDRAFRIGQRKDVQVRKFVCVGTLEERIDSMLEQKKALAERIVGTGESWLTELSVAELRKVITLSPEAVSE